MPTVLRGHPVNNVHCFFFPNHKGTYFPYQHKYTENCEIDKKKKDNRQEKKDTLSDTDKSSLCARI